MSTNFSEKISDTPAPPYYAVIFTSLRTEGDNGYAETAKRMEELSSQYPGFLGLESARSGLGITVCYWNSLEAIQNWKKNTEHMMAQQKGKAEWYSNYRIRICKVEREYGMK